MNLLRAAGDMIYEITDEGGKKDHVCIKQTWKQTGQAFAIHVPRALLDDFLKKEAPRAACLACGRACLECSQASFAEKKEAFHKKYLAIFRAVAKILGLGKADYDLRSNKGGSAIMGEVTFHTSYVYAQVSGDYQIYDGEHSFFYRTVESRKDFHGGMNQWLPLSALEGDAKVALAAFRACAKQKKKNAELREANEKG